MRMLWIPPGFAHGFVVLSDGAHVLTKATEFDRPELERTVAWMIRTWTLSGHLKDTRLFLIRRNAVCLCDKPRCSTSDQDG